MKNEEMLVKLLRKDSLKDNWPDIKEKSSEFCGLPSVQLLDTPRLPLEVLRKVWCTAAKPTAQLLLLSSCQTSATTNPIPQHTAHDAKAN